MSMLDKKFKRDCFPVPDCEGTFVRPLKDSESRQQKTIEDSDLKLWFTLGMCLTDVNSIPLFTKAKDETPADFAERVRIELDDADFDFLHVSKCSYAIGRVAKYDPEELRKN